MKKNYDSPEVTLIRYTAEEDLAADVGNAMSGNDVEVVIPGGPEGEF